MSGAGIYIKTDSGLVAAATVPGPQGSQGPQSSLTTGTVTTGAAGTSAAATITGWAVTYGDTAYVDPILETGTAGNLRIITPSPTHEAYSEIAWVTDHQWPATLPGTPA